MSVNTDGSTTTAPTYARSMPLAAVRPRLRMPWWVANDRPANPMEVVTVVRVMGPATSRRTTPTSRSSSQRCTTWIPLSMPMPTSSG